MEYLIHLATIFSIYAILAISLNVIVGYTGLLSVTQAAFYGIGAYTTAILITAHNVNFFLAMLAGIVTSGVLSFLIGLVLSKFDDDYYALASLGFCTIVFSIFLNFDSLTRGPLGIPGIARPSFGFFTFNSNLSFLILALVILGLVFAVCRFVVNSSFGRVLKAIREDEKALKVFGYRTILFKLGAFVLSAILASLAGALFASYITFIDPSTFSVPESIFILAIVILGGLANIKGSVWGALFMILLPEALRFVGMPNDIAAQMRQVIYGVLLVVLMMYRPQGFMGEYKL